LKFVGRPAPRLRPTQHEASGTVKPCPIRRTAARRGAPPGEIARDESPLTKLLFLAEGTADRIESTLHGLIDLRTTAHLVKLRGAARNGKAPA